jgi:ethanolamine utilization protein EutQ (cupin superfamily)
VIIDNLGPLDVAAEFAHITLGPGSVNFVPTGQGVTLTDIREGGSTPQPCVFPTLPTPDVPPGWLR